MDELQESRGMGALEAQDSGPKPKRWVAILLSFLCVGAGQFYCGFLKRGLVFLLLEMGLFWVLTLTLAYAPNFLLFDGFVAFFPLVFSAVAAWDAQRCARRPNARKFSFLLVLAFVLLAWFLPEVVKKEPFGGPDYPVRSYFIPSGSMLPTLQTGDYIWVRMVRFEPKRGDIVVFAPPDNYPGDKSQLVSRIAAVGGDEVEVKSGALFLNGTKQDEPYISEPMRDDFQKFRVPDHQYFMLGDNRNDSFDSRYWHAVPRDHLKGRVIGIYWSRQPGRLGKSL